MGAMQKFGKKEGGGRRRAAREEAPLTAVITTLTCSHSALVVDVSCTGARLRGDELPSKGQEMILSVEKLRTFGIVVWSRRGECGVRFDPPLEPLDIHDFATGFASVPACLASSGMRWRTGMSASLADCSVAREADHTEQDEQDCCHKG
jgi:PilZ domain